MEIEITKSKINEIKSFIRDFIKQRKIVDTEIKSYNATEIDLYKSSLFEEYIAGALTMLKCLQINYIVAENDSDFDIEFYEDKTINIDDSCQKSFLYIYNTLKEHLDSKPEMLSSKDKKAFEKIIHEKIYCLLGAEMVASKFEMTFSLKTNTLVKEKLNSLDSDLYNVHEMVDEINEITKKLFYKINMECSINNYEWQISLTKNLCSNFNEYMNINNENGQNFEKIEMVNMISQKNLIRQEEIVTKLNEDYIMVQNEHDTLLNNFLLKYIYKK